MKTSDHMADIEIEAKFQGGPEECEGILSWLAAQGFGIERKEPVQRVHVYFDDNEHLRLAGCRLRCVFAPGEWYRYDFKADDPSGGGETSESSVKHPQPVSVAEAIESLRSLVPSGPPRQALDALGKAPAIVFVLDGSHEKAMARGEGLELEVSRDLLTCMKSGCTLSEVEVELVSGHKPEFDRLMARMEAEIPLLRTDLSKLESFYRNLDDL